MQFLKKLPKRIGKDFHDPKRMNALILTRFKKRITGQIPMKIGIYTHVHHRTIHPLLLAFCCPHPKETHLCRATCLAVASYSCLNSQTLVQNRKGV